MSRTEARRATQNQMRWRCSIEVQGPMLHQVQGKELVIPRLHVHGGGHMKKNSRMQECHGQLEARRVSENQTGWCCS
jgi:hypothetical protein